MKRSPSSEGAIGWCALERVAAAPVFVVALVMAGLLVHAMATTSLWNDELFSIDRFSSQGVIASLTRYPGPNNHILYNALTALLPLPDRTDPLGARAWSFVFVGGGFVALGVALARRKLWLELAVAAHLLLFSRALIRSALEARGYGMLLACGLGLALATAAVFGARRRGDGAAMARALACVGALALAGTWAVPTFGLFAAPLVALLVAVLRTRAAWVMAGLTLAAVLAAYLPLTAELIAVQRRYGDNYGYQFGELSAIPQTLASGLLHDSTVGVRAGPWVSAGFGALLVLATAGAWRRDRATGTASALLLVASAAFFAACLALRTPLVRTAVFVVAPLLLAGLLAVGSWWSPARTPRRRALLAVAFALAVVPADLGAIRGFGFLPREDWRGVARLAAAALPEDVCLCAPFRGWSLRLHLPDGPEVCETCTAADLLAGRVAYQFDDHPRAADAQLGAEVLAATLAVPFAEERGAGWRVLHLAPPERTVLKALALEPERPGSQRAIDRVLSTAVELDASAELQSLVLIPEPGVPLRTLVVATTAQGVRFVDGVVQHDDDTTTPLASPLVERDGALLLPLGDRPARRIAVSLRVEPADGETAPALREIWIYPTRS